MKDVAFQPVDRHSETTARVPWSIAEVLPPAVERVRQRLERRQLNPADTA